MANTMAMTSRLSVKMENHAENIQFKICCVNRILFDISAWQGKR